MGEAISKQASRASNHPVRLASTAEYDECEWIWEDGERSGRSRAGWETIEWHNLG